MYGPFGYAAIVALVVSAALLLRWLASRRFLIGEARIEYEERRLTKPRTVKNVSEDAFERLFVAAHERRWALYTAAALIAAVIVSPPAFILLTALWPILVMALEEGPWYDAGHYPWMFYMFFGLCGVWAGCGFLAARLFHARAPEPFNAALARARGEPLEDTPLPQKRPDWAKRRDAAEETPDEKKPSKVGGFEDYRPDGVARPDDPEKLGFEVTAKLKPMGDGSRSWSGRAQVRILLAEARQLCVLMLKEDPLDQLERMVAAAEALARGDSRVRLVFRDVYFEHALDFERGDDARYTPVFVSGNTAESEDGDGDAWPRHQVDTADLIAALTGQLVAGLLALNEIERYLPGADQLGLENRINALKETG